MRKVFVPRGAFQDGGTEFILNHNRSALHVDMGLGKTMMTVNAIHTLLQCGWKWPTLILAPLRVARSTWSDEIARWDHTKHIAISRIVGDPDERKRALRQKADIYTTNYENLEWLVKELNGDWPFKWVIADESAKLKSMRASIQVSSKGKEFMKVSPGCGTRMAAIAKVAHTKTLRWTNLTGLPAPNGLLDLWGQMFFVDKGQRLGRSYSGMEERWFKTGFNGYEKIMLPYAEQEIQKAIADVTFTLRAEDYLDLGEEIINNIWVDLPTSAERPYREMERALYTEIQAGEVEVFTQAAKSNKLHQLANGSIYYDKEGRFEAIHEAKIEALRSVIEEAGGMPVIVCYTYKADLIRLQKAFPKGVAFDTKPKTEKDFKAGKISLLFLHPDSAGHGIDGFQRITNIMCFFSIDWNLDSRMQVIARIGKVRQFQAGLNRPAFIHNIVTRNTIDEDILERLETKKTIEQSLSLGLARRNLK